MNQQGPHSSRTAVTIAKRFYDAQEMMKRLLGDEYDAKVTETRRLIEALMKARSASVLEATQYAAKVISKNMDSGMTIAMLLATAVEMIEGDN